MLRSLTFCAMFTFTALAADVTGKWKLVLHAPDGQTFEATMALKAEGRRLVGTITGQGGEAQIQDGAVDGDTITFKVVRNERVNQYQGEVTGDRMRLVIRDGDREATITATRE